MAKDMSALRNSVSVTIRGFTPSHYRASADDVVYSPVDGHVDLHSRCLLFVDLAGIGIRSHPNCSGARHIAFLGLF